MSAALDQRGPENRQDPPQPRGFGDQTGSHAGTGGPESSASHETNGAARPNPLDGIKTSFAELALYAGHYFAALRDLAVTRVRLAIFWLIVGLGLLIVGLTTAIVAVVLVLQGIALGLGALLWGQFWAGALITGAVVLGACAVAVMIAYHSMVSQWHRQMAGKYEHYKQRERAERHLQ